MTTPSPWAVARADALMDAAQRRGAVATHWQEWSAGVAMRDVIALALDEVRADERERAAGIVDRALAEAKEHRQGIGSPVKTNTEIVLSRVDAAIRTPSPKRRTTK